MTEDDELRYCICADPENCREEVPGYVCRRVVKGATSPARLTDSEEGKAIGSATDRLSLSLSSPSALRALIEFVDGHCAMAVETEFHRGWHAAMHNMRNWLRSIEADLEAVLGDTSQNE